MNARYLVIGGLLGFILAATALSPSTAAQDEVSKGIFGALKVGEMVEVRVENIGMVINHYDDPAFKNVMTYKITEIERDYIALEFHDANGGELEMRYPASTLVGVCHVKKVGKAPTTKKKKSAD
jgi:hypothetical protein